MRTTVAIDDELLARAKRRARQLGVSLGDLVEAGLRRELSTEPGAEVVPLPVFDGGSGPRPGLDLTSNRAMREALDEELGLDRRR